MLVILMFIIISLILIFDYVFFKKNITHPCIIFTFSFFILNLFAIFFIKKWELNIDIKTVSVIIGGIIIFNIISIIFEIIKKRKNNKQDCKIEKIEIQKWIEICFIIFIVIFNIIYFLILAKKIGIKISNFSDIGKVLNTYAYLIKFQDDYTKVSLPFIITNIRVAIVGAGFWFSYVFAHNIIFFKKRNIRQIGIIILCVICSLLTGSRGEAIEILVSLLTYLLYNYIIVHKKIEKKLAIKLITTAFIVLIIFTPLAKIMGRATGDSAIDYIGIYCGAELKNLDSYIRENNMNNAESISDTITFSSINTTIAKLTNDTKYIHYRGKFREINGINLGNVYTIYYSFLFDYGYGGYIIFTSIMAIISNFIFMNIKLFRYKNKNSSIWLISYGIVAFTLLFSFFSNYFYTTIFSSFFIRYLIVWIILNYFFIKKDNLEVKKENK